MSNQIKNRLTKLEKIKEQRDNGSVIVINGPYNMSVEEWEAVAVDYMERARQISKEMRQAADAIYSTPGGRGSS